VDAGARNPFIDLLRGVSIGLVLLHHFNIAYRLNDTALARALGWALLHAIVRNGNYAVTMFFVISGFLITSNTKHRCGRLADVGLAGFYRNRFARIIPTLVLTLAIVSGLAAMSIPIFQNHSEFGGPVTIWLVDVASLTFWLNVLMSHVGWVNYAICVQWSLSIEEVFYLAFPLLCLLLRRERFLIVAWSLFIVAGPIWRATQQATEYDELNAYLACFDGIAFGCIAAVIAPAVRLPSWTTIAVAIAMAGFYLSASIADNAVYGVTLIAFGTAILLRCRRVTRPWPILAPLRRCGRLSYELYLFHIIVLAGLRAVWHPTAVTGDEKLPLLVAYLVLSVIVAVLVSRFWGEPLNRRLRALSA
jgi:peptidoglycan/LPS O-acetylase OafA/YrhL